MKFQKIEISFHNKSYIYSYIIIFIVLIPTIGVRDHSSLMTPQRLPYSINHSYPQTIHLHLSLEPLPIRCELTLESSPYSSIGVF